VIRRRIATLKDLKLSAANITIAQGDSVMWTALQPNFHNVADLDHLAREGVLFETAVTNATDLSLPASRAFRQVR